MQSRNPRNGGTMMPYPCGQRTAATVISPAALRRKAFESISVEGALNVTVDAVLKKGDPGQCQIWVALGNWDYRKYGGTPDCPVQVNTTDRKTFFDTGSPAAIAYGSYTRADFTQGWTQIEIPLEYRYKNRKPTHIIS